MEIILKSKNKDIFINDDYASMDLTIEKFKIKYPFSTNIFCDFQKKVLCTHCDVQYNITYQKNAPIFFLNCFRKLDISKLDDTNNVYGRIFRDSLNNEFKFENGDMKNGYFTKTTNNDQLPKTLNVVDSLYDIKKVNEYNDSALVLKEKVIGGWLQTDSKFHPRPNFHNSYLLNSHLLNSTQYLLFKKNKLLTFVSDEDLDVYVPHLEFVDVPTFLFKEEKEVKESIYFSLEIAKQETTYDSTPTLTEAKKYFKDYILRSESYFLIHLYFDFVLKTNDLYSIHEQLKN